MCFLFPGSIQMRKIGALTFGVGALAKKLPFLKQAQGAKPWSWGAGSDVRGRAIGKIKKFGYAGMIFLSFLSVKMQPAHLVGLYKMWVS